MKKSKIIPYLIMIALTIASLSFGVYSLIEATFTASGNILFNAYGLDILVEGTITNAIEGSGGTINTKYYAATKSSHNNANYTDKVNENIPQWSIGLMAFDEFNRNNIITIQLKVTNYSEFSIEATAVITNQTEMEQSLTITNTPINYIYGYDENTDVAPNSGTIIMTFAPTANATEFNQGLNITIEIVPSEKIPTEETAFSIDDNGEITYFSQRSDTNVIIPKAIGGVNVNKIGNTVFAGCNLLKSITFPNSVIGIGDTAFTNCSNLTNIEIPDSVESFGSAAFMGCAISSIIIPAGVTRVTEHAFSNCKNLVSIIISNDVVSIGSDAFGNCSKLTNIIIPNNVTSIEQFAFNGCTSLVSITIPSSVVNMEFRIFQGCTSLTIAKFENSSGWLVCDMNTGNQFKAITTPTSEMTRANATLLKTTYADYYWKRVSA